MGGSSSNDTGGGGVGGVGSGGGSSQAGMTGSERTAASESKSETSFGESLSEAREASRSPNDDGGDKPDKPDKPDNDEPDRAAGPPGIGAPPSSSSPTDNDNGPDDTDDGGGQTDRAAGPPGIGAPPSSSSPTDNDNGPDDTDDGGGQTDRAAGPPGIGAPPSSSSPADTDNGPDDTDDGGGQTDRAAGPPGIGAPPSSFSPADTDNGPDDTDDPDDRSFVDRVADTLSAPPTDAESNPRPTSPVTDRIDNTQSYSIDDIKDVFGADEPPVTPEQSQALANGAAVIDGVTTVPSLTPAATAVDPIAAEQGLDILGRPTSFDDANRIQVAGDFMPNIADIEHLTKFEVRGPGGSVTAASGRDEHGNLITDGSLKVGRGPVSGTINTNGEGTIQGKAGPVSGQVKTDDSAGIGASIPGYSKHVETDGTVVETYGGTTPQFGGPSFTAEATVRTLPDGEVTRTYTGGAGLGTKERGISAEISIVDRDVEKEPTSIDQPTDPELSSGRTYENWFPERTQNSEQHEKDTTELDASLEAGRREREAERKRAAENAAVP